jgi:molybdate transport system ATP-binding protein
VKTEDRDILVIIGPTGSGKTTVLNLIAGFVIPDRGSIIVDGLDITKVPVESRRIGYVFQSPSLFPHLTVYENIVFGVDKRSRKENKIQIMNLLHDLNVSHLSSRRIQGLSGGEMQKVALARVLVTKPKVMLMDEPLSQLDSPTKMKLRLDLRRVLKNQRVPTIYVTHFEDDVYGLADTICTLQDGIMEYTGNLESILARSNTSSSPFLSNVFTGGNYLEGKVIRSNAGVTIFRIGSHLLETLGNYSVGHKVGILLKPEDIILSKDIVKTSARNAVKARVISITRDHGNLGVVFVHLHLDGFTIIAKITEESRIDLGIKENEYVFAIFKASTPQAVREG